MKITRKNKGYLIVLTLIASNLFLFQNCSNYSVGLKSEETLASTSSNLQMIADNSAALNDDSVPIQLDPPSIPTQDDMRPEDEMNTSDNQLSDDSMESADQDAEESVDQDVENNNANTEEDKACHNRGRKNCEYRNRCNLLAAAGGTLKGFNVITLTSEDEGKTLSSHGKTIYTYGGSTTLHLQSIKASGNTVICGNVSIANLQSNGNCHLFYTQIEQASVNGSITTYVLDEEGRETEVDAKHGHNAKSCKVNSDASILPL